MVLGDALALGVVDAGASTDDLEILLAVKEKEVRRKAAAIKRLSDVELPGNLVWRTDPCDRHEKAVPDCDYRACGGELWKHQRVGIAWLYFVKKGGVLDWTGTGKTNQPIGLIELLRSRGEPHRALIVCGSTGAVEQWANEFRRFTPHLHVETGTGSPRDRISRYSGNWDVMVISAHVMLRDRKILQQLDFDVLVEDDVDPIRHGGSNSKMTQTSVVYNELALERTYVVNMNATALQIELMDLYWTVVSIGGFEEFGSPKMFERRYVRKEPYTYYDRRTGRTVRGFKTVGYRNMNEFKEKFGPYFIRRTFEDVEADVQMPKVMPPEDLWLELTVPQRQRYAELQEGVLRLIREQGEHVQSMDALGKFTYGRMLISGLYNLDEGRDSELASVKLNWLENKVFGEWADEKIVVFSQYKGTIRAMRERFVPRGCDLALIWGEHKGNKAKAYQREVEKFWSDPKCRVAVGTTAIERSLNLQAARIIVNYDLLLNPQRMTQILGRVKRGGSRHKRVYVFNLFARDTQEEGYPEILKRRAALSSFVFDDTSELFASLSPLEMLMLIRR